ncbi:MAG: integrase, partial [Massilia sp.]|nr:integrase [Massilia sp.]
MRLSLGVSMSIQTRYLQKRGAVFQFVMRVPADLVKRYGQQFVRESLKTSDEREAIRKTELLAKKYLAQFKALQGNQTLTPVEVTASATEIAQAYGELDVFLDHVVEPKRQKHAAGDEERYLDDPEAYLSPKELQVVQVLQEGVETVRLSTAIGLYWKSHKKSGDADFVEGVERDWNRFMALIGDVPVMSLTRAQARAFVEHLTSDGLKTTSVRRKLNHVKAVLSAAIREADLIRPNPFANLQISGEGQDAKPASVPTRETLEDIARTLQDDTSA